MIKKKIFTVNDALNNLSYLNNKPVYLEVILGFELEDICMNHFPEIETRDFPYSSIWIALNYNILQFNQRVMTKWHGKRIIVTGTLQKADSFLGGTGHMCLWLASIQATDIILFKNYNASQI